LSPLLRLPKKKEVKAAELQVRQLEAAKAMSAMTAPWWRRADPLVLAIFAGVLTLLGNMGVALLNDHNSVKQEQEKTKDDQALQEAKARFDLVLQAMATNDPSVAKRNIHFFIDAGLLKDSDCKIREAIDQDQPVLPSLSGGAPVVSEGIHSAPEIASLYNFPSGLDGRGVTIGILEFGGHLNPDDIMTYFKELSLPAPDVVTISVEGFVPSSDLGGDSQVSLDVELIGALAPRARLRVYFSQLTSVGFARAIKRASEDRVAILSIGWGQAESKWKDEEIKEINAALEDAARQNITVVAAVGTQGVTDGVADGGRHVDFPASSPWVLAVGSTTLKSASGRITSETVWMTDNKSGLNSATGGGVSTKFERPDWQSEVPAINRDNGRSGRGLPDVVASGDPGKGVEIVIRGSKVVVGGAGTSVPVWVGLIARLNQALGYNVGYLNPRLYQKIDPESVLRNISKGQNSISGVEGYSAGPGWSPVAGWGSPDGSKLLDWLRTHPDRVVDNRLSAVACPPSSR
jgi:hypothetical protein